MAQIEIRGLSLQYKSSNKKILDNANATFSSGDAILVSGENGVGKSSFLKTMLRLEMSGKIVSGKIYYSGNDIIGMNEKELKAQRRAVAYLQQQDDYDSLDGYTVADILFDSFEAHNGRRPTKNDKSAIQDTFYKYVTDEAKISLKSKIQKLSGGQKRLVSIIADICMFDNLSYYLIDEPLNNLDVRTVRLISNLFNRLHRENPETVLVIVSHCRIFPFINKIFKIENQKLVEDIEMPIYYSCFGLPDENGYY